MSEILTQKSSNANFPASDDNTKDKVGEGDSYDSSSYYDDMFGDRHLMVGQVYYSLNEAILFKVFEDVGYPFDIHVYELEHMREAFEETNSGEEGAVFKNNDQKSKAISTWDSIQKSIGWSEKDFNDIEKFQYGYSKKHLNIKELREHLKYAENSSCFYEEDIEVLDRCITMLEKIEKLIYEKTE